MRWRYKVQRARGRTDKNKLGAIWNAKRGQDNSMTVDVVRSYIKMKCWAVSGESAMSVTVVGRKSDRKQFDKERAVEGREGEDRGRRQERTNEGEGHIYRFLGKGEAEPKFDFKQIYHSRETRYD